MRRSVAVVLAAMGIGTVGSIGWAWGGAVHLARTGQLGCWDVGGISVDCLGTGQDGDKRAGAAWPAGRFVSGSGAEADCVLDRLTGLMWAKVQNAAIQNWSSAVVWAFDTAALCGYTDWRLPNLVELESLENQQEANLATWLATQGFGTLLAGNAWSSSTQADVPDQAWYLFVWDGQVDYQTKSTRDLVWPVRTAGPGAIQLPRSGQQRCWDAGGTVVDCGTDYAGPGQDGALRRGNAWPSPRFTGNGDGTVTDNLTGLVWLRDANCTETVGGVAKGSGFLTWPDALTWSNHLATGNCALNDGSHAGDWRLPNKKELASLVDLERAAPAVPNAAGSGGWTAGDPFVNLPFGTSIYLWTSTTVPDSLARAWQVDLWDGWQVSRPKTNNGYVWPVRGGGSAATLFDDGLESGGATRWSAALP